MVRYEKSGIIRKKDVTRTNISKNAGKFGYNSFIA